MSSLLPSRFCGLCLRLCLLRSSQPFTKDLCFHLLVFPFSFCDGSASANSNSRYGRGQRLSRRRCPCSSCNNQVPRSSCQLLRTHVLSIINVMRFGFKTHALASSTAARLNWISASPGASSNADLNQKIYQWNNVVKTAYYAPQVLDREHRHRGRRDNIRASQICNARQPSS